MLQDAGVELGSNYDWPIVTGAEARSHVAYACSVTERCISTRGGHSGSAASEPYRLATEPNEEALPPLEAAAAAAMWYAARADGGGKHPEVEPAPEYEVSDEEVRGA